MLALAARPLGAGVVCVGRDGPASPAAVVCDVALAWSDDPHELVTELVATVDVVTFEFESVPPALLDALGSAPVPCRPGAEVVAVAADRTREKAMFVGEGVPTVAHRSVDGTDEAVDAVAELGGQAVVKTATLGYDGRGQVTVDASVGADGVRRSVEGLGAARMIVEERLSLAAEWSVVVCRDAAVTAAYQPFENVHRAHILDTTRWPARGAPDMLDEVTGHSRRLADALDLAGVICVEWFVTDDGRVLANEIAPRPHNSGHLTIEAAATSQFAQQARIALGLGVGAVSRRRPAAMANLLGDLWEGGSPDWAAALGSAPSAADLHLHLYGKEEARAGRKMGHLTALADDPQEALDVVRTARSALHARPAR